MVDDSKPISVLPSAVLNELGIAPSMNRLCTMPDGSLRDINFGYVWLRLNGREGMTYFAFGDALVQPRLGRVAINSLLLEVDPACNKLVPMTNLLL